MSKEEAENVKAAPSIEAVPADATKPTSSPVMPALDSSATATSSTLPSGTTTPALPDLTMPDKVVEALRSTSFPATNGLSATDTDAKDKNADKAVILGIAVVDFNHLVGPQVEYAHPKELAEDEELCGKLPFLALPDGSHLSDEDFCYFHIVSKTLHPATVFGISCNRQIASSQLAVRGKEVTRSTVQKAVVVLARDPVFGPIKEKLGVVTRAFFAQGDFGDTDILIEFHATLEAGLRAARGTLRTNESLVATSGDTAGEQEGAEARKASKASDRHDEREAVMYMGTSLRELIFKWRFKTLMLLKLLLLQKKIMFFGYPVERLCTYQYSLVSLVPDLMLALEDSGSPTMDRQSSKRKRAESLKTSDRKSLLRFMGLPLHLFGQGAFFQPYLPLQQIDVASKAESYLVGTTNSIFRQQKEMAVDVVVDLEQTTLEFIDPRLQHIVSLTAADRKWMDEVVNVVLETWNAADPSRPSTMQYSGSDDYLRAKFEEYICAMLSTVKYNEHIGTSTEAPPKSTISTPSLASSSVVLPPLDTAGQQSYPPSTSSSTPAGPPRDVGIEAFGADFVQALKLTKAYALWDATTDPMLCDIVPHKHPCEGRTSTLEDVSLRLTAGFHDLHLDEQLGPTREALGNAWQQGSQTAWKLANKWGNDLAKFRRDQIAKAAEAREGSGQAAAAADVHSPEKGIHHVSSSTTSGGAAAGKEGINTAEVMASAQALQAQAQAAAAQAGTHVRQALGNFGTFWSARQKAWGTPQAPSSTAQAAPTTPAAETSQSPVHAYQPRIPKSPPKGEEQADAQKPTS